MTRNIEPSIRFATPDDARGILEVHYSAVHETAARHYPQKVITDWAPPVAPDRIEKYRVESLPRHTTLVAEVNGTIAGYGVILESRNVLRDLYVSPTSGGQGIGSALLRALEKLAKARGCKELQMNATLAAEAFYLRHGYEELERGEYTLSSGCKVACIRMRKEF